MIGFAVIGRPFNPDIHADGYIRNEPAILLRQLALRNLQHTYAVLGKPVVGNWSGIPNNAGAAFPPDTKMSSIIVWLAGGFAAMRQDTPRLDGTPQEYRRTLAVYVQPIADILQAHTGRTIWIVNDPRSYFRARDVPRPFEILSQHTFRKAGVHYVAAGTDMAAMPYFHPVWRDNDAFHSRTRRLPELQVVSSTAGKHGRVEAIERYRAQNLYPLNQAKYTLWLRTADDTVLFPPSSRSQWITAKFWECAANGVIPWMAEGYDSQNVSGVNDKGLDFLRVSSLPDLVYKREVLFKGNPGRLTSVRHALRRLYEDRFQSKELAQNIEARLAH